MGYFVDFAGGFYMSAVSNWKNRGFSNTVEGLGYSGKYPKAAAASQQAESGRRPAQKQCAPQ
ncbi:MAG: hypothetical protein AB7S92_21550 [Parvibaculaceae bacterium]